MIYETLKKEDKLVVNDVNIDWRDKLIIAGPCTFGSYE